MELSLQEVELSSVLLELVLQFLRHILWQMMRDLLCNDLVDILKDACVDCRRQYELYRLGSDVPLTVLTQGG